MKVIKAATVQIEQNRWSDTIRITDTDGVVNEYYYALPLRSHHRRSRASVVDQLVARVNAAEGARKP